MTQPLVINGAPASLGIVLPGAIFANQPNDIAFQYQTYIHEHSTAFQLTTTADLDFATLTSYSQYRKDWQADNSEYAIVAPGLLHILFTNSEKLITQELLLNSNPGSRLQWTTGAFFLDNDAALNAFPAVGYTDSGYYFASGSYGDTQSIAGYADVTYQVLDRLFLTGGVRYSHDQMLDGQTRLATSTVTFPTLTYNKTTSRAVVRYSLDDKSNIYASFSQGFKAGLWDLGGTNTTTPVAPETISAYEAGLQVRLSWPLGRSFGLLL